jgi:hypothetical protein
MNISNGAAAISIKIAVMENHSMASTFLFYTLQKAHLNESKSLL